MEAASSAPAVSFYNVTFCSLRGGRLGRCCSTQGFHMVLSVVTGAQNDSPGIKEIDMTFVLYIHLFCHYSLFRKCYMQCNYYWRFLRLFSTGCFGRWHQACVSSLRQQDLCSKHPGFLMYPRLFLCSGITLRPIEGALCTWWWGGVSDSLQFQVWVRE